MIFAYNKAHVGDTLIVMMADDKGLEQTVERKFNIAQIKNSAGTIVGWNFFHVSEFLSLTGSGAISLTDEQIDLLNEKLAISGFSEKLPYDHAPHFVVGFVKSCVPHPDSDHLSITQTEVDNGEVLQIVCGAANIREGLKVVVAKPGTMMPDGMLIWPGVLRGVESYGMICSAKELELPNAPQKKGILELSQDAVVGSEFKLA
ncbi:tRNA-binding protein [Enterococcus saigonensis]|uniref:tRNA-binding protein n=1 Tax=Enterococcus saigonensis TaxID=1805431 RepID=A0A679IK06_9ENTE|nr:DUF4479 and tRNA-binding domain-containing protein [Enterococcus saigonensis]BCA86482.1 tRNA-binding protein [Enterococcus saigonensis]